MNYLNWNPQRKEAEKERILTALFNDGGLHRLIDFMAYKANCVRSTAIVADIVQHVFCQISRKSPDYILRSYFGEDDGSQGCLKNLIGLGVRICQREGIGGSKPYPKSSVAKNILYASNLNQLASLSPTEEEVEGNHSFHVLVDESTEEDEDPYVKMWAVIRQNLTFQQLRDLDFFLTHRKKQGRWKLDEYKRKEDLLSRIEEIVTAHKLVVRSRPVIKLDEDGEELETYSSVQRASKATGLKAIEITASCSDRTGKKKAGGFSWMYQPIIKF